MLQFFRKHQKVFFIIVTFFIVVSFSFFGTSGTLTQREEVSDREIGRLVDGTPLKEQKLHGFIRLLQNGIEEGGRSSNLLNDSVIHKDVLLSGLGEILIEHDFAQFEEELAEKWERMKRYSPYVHPNAPHISATAIWAQMAPEINELLQEVRKAPDAFTIEQLPLLFALYKAQAEFPQPLLLQMLYYQQMQGGQIRPDPGLPNANVALFGFQTVEDWFGATFVEEIAKFILNAACIAKEEGYTVKRDEAHVDLVRNVYQGLKIYDPETTPTNEQAQMAFTNQVRYIGLTDAEAIAMWGEVLHFRRLFHEVGDSVFVDKLCLSQFKNFAKPLCKITRYGLPADLKFSTFHEMVQFQRYLEAAYKGECCKLPSVARESKVILAEHPELVAKPVKVTIAAVSKDEVAARISLKETWGFEGKEENFARLAEEFPVLAGKELGSEEDRLEALDKLDAKTRLKIDQRARHLLVDAHPEGIEQALARAERRQQTLKVRLKGGPAPLSGEKFLGMLETQDPSLNCYTVDDEVFYSVQVDELGGGWHLLPFAEVKADGTMDTMLDALVETTDMELETIYQDLIKSIAFGSDDLDELARHRFDDYLNEMRLLVMADREAFVEKQKTAIWALEEREEQKTEDEVALEVGEFSPISGHSFYQFLEKEELVPSEAEIAEAKEHLKADAQQKLMRQLLQRL